MGKRAELEIEAIRLYAEGNEIPAIAAALEVSENSLRKWKARAGTEWADARKAARADRIVAIEDIGSRLRRSREIASQITGSARDQGAVGLVLNQSVQTMLYDLMEKIDTTTAIDPDDMGKMSKLIGNITLALGRTEQAASRNLKTAAEIRKTALNDAAAAVESEAKRQGASAATIDSLRAAIMQELSA